MPHGDSLDQCVVPQLALSKQPRKNVYKIFDFAGEEGEEGTGYLPVCEGIDAIISLSNRSHTRLSFAGDAFDSLLEIAAERDDCTEEDARAALEAASSEAAATVQGLTLFGSK